MNTTQQCITTHSFIENKWNSHDEDDLYLLYTWGKVSFIFLYNNVLCLWWCNFIKNISLYNKIINSQTFRLSTIVLNGCTKQKASIISHFRYENNGGTEVYFYFLKTNISHQNPIIVFLPTAHLWV